MQQKTKLSKKSKLPFFEKRSLKGFTIVEIIIVLAIVGGVMVLMLVGIPQAQAARRDAARRTYVQTVYQAMQEYIKNNGRFPSCDYLNPCPSSMDSGVGGEAKRFLLNYVPEGKDPSTGHDYVNKNPSHINAHDASTWRAGNTFFNYRTIPHEGFGPNPEPGRVYIGAGHWCRNSKPLSGEPDWYPVSSDTPGSNESHPTNFVIIMSMERGRYFCLDNYITGD